MRKQGSKEDLKMKIFYIVSEFTDLLDEDTILNTVIKSTKATIAFQKIANEVESEKIEEENGTEEDYLKALVSFDKSKF